jgi:DNA-binding PadR family transcriptional regulator
VTPELLPEWLFKPLTPLELYALIALAKWHNYPYGIAQAIAQDLDHSVQTTPQGVTRALKRMAKKGWVTPYPHMQTTGRRERAYELTEFGAQQLEHEINRLTLILQVGRDRLAIRAHFLKR